MNINFIKKNLFVIILLACVVFIPIFSFAQGHAPAPSEPSVKIVNPIGVNDLNGLIKSILEGAIKIGIPIIALAIIYSGFLFVSAQGNAEKLKTAKRALIYSLVGAAILLGSWAIAQLISETVISVTA
jgi:hypothetical protein